MSYLLPTKHNGLAAPMCEAPKIGNECTERAVADVPTVFGPWASLCEKHVTAYASSGAPRLGTLYGQGPVIGRRTGAE